MDRTDIPDDLAAAVRGAADAVPAHAGDLAAARTRGRARRRHRAVAATGLAAVAAATAIAVPSSLAGPAGGPAGTEPAATSAAPPAAPAQRLLVDASGGMVRQPAEDDREGLVGADIGESPREAYQRYRDRPGANGVFGGYAEVLPDGSVVDVEFDLPGIDTVREVVALPDGRFVLTGTIDRMPGVDRRDGPCVKGIDIPLLVVEADGSVSLTRQVRVRCETVTLVGANVDTAYLVRDSRLVAHDLATGDERVLLDSPEVLEPSGPGGHRSVIGGRAGVAGGRMASLAVDNQDGCTGSGTEVLVAELDTGATAAHPMPVSVCVGSPGPLRMSPDGRYAAVAYYQVPPIGLRVTVVDLDTGGVAADRVLLTANPGAEGYGGTTGPRQVLLHPYGGIVGLAWGDDRTLQVGWYEVPEDGVHWVTDVLQVATMPVG